MLLPKSDGKSVVLSCFSPPVMAATFLLEMGMVLFILWRYRLRTPERITVILILCLAAFQAAEYNICVGDPSLALNWTKFGLTAILLLPALGLHLSSQITKRTASTRLAYMGAAAMICCFLFVPQATDGAYCAGNYVIIQSNALAGFGFGLYYWGFLFLLLYEVYVAVTSSKKIDQRSRSILEWLALGYSTFMVPMIIAYLLSPALIHGAPSIMCGFAVFLAIILTLKIVPEFQLLGTKTAKKSKRSAKPHTA